MKFRRYPPLKFITLILGLVVLGGLIGVIVAQGPNLAAALGSVAKFHLGQVSTVTISTQDNSLNFRFKIAQDDLKTAHQFSQNLRIADGWWQGISLQLDPAAINQLKNSLPATANLRFEPQKLEFSSRQTLTLQSGLSQSHLEYATYSGKLSLDRQTERAYFLQIKQPGDLVKGATRSGNLYLSPKLEQLFPTLARVATIKIKVQDTQLSGEIDLR